MNANIIIIQALKEFTDSGYDISQDIHEGKSDHYIVYNYADERAVEYQDDIPQTERCEMYIHFYLPLTENYMSLKKRVRSLLFRSGFNYPSVEQMTDTELDVRHLIFDCEIDGYIEMED